jgi:glycosyltransferase involved in cell wall biosynthesis
MRVLYVSHTADVSGAERSLLETISAVRGEVEPILACPEGELPRRARAEGVRTERIGSVRVGFGSRGRTLAAAARQAGRAAWEIRRLARSLDVDVVHAASARAGIVAGLGWACGGVRPIVDVRDVLPSGRRAAVVRAWLRLTAHTLIFNSEFTRTSFGPTRPARDRIVYPPVDVERLLRLPLRDELRVPPTLGVVAQITPWKAQDDAIRILALVRREQPDARLRIVGDVVFAGDGVTFDNEAFRSLLVDLVAELGLAEAIDLAGASDDLEAVFGSLDVLLVPSWEEPFGRVVVEAMAAGVPVVATSRGGPRELVEHGRTGYLAEPRKPEAWVEPVLRLLRDQELRSALAARARAAVERGAANRPSVLLGLYDAVGLRRPQGRPSAAESDRMPA